MVLLQSKVSCWLLFIITRCVCGLSLLETLTSYPELSTLSSRIKASSVLSSLLGGVDDFTFFAPTNTAIERFLKGQPNTTQDANFQTMVQYSLIKGGFSRSSFTNESQFAASDLIDTKYSNVTGGQVVELIKNGGKMEVISGNRSISALTTLDIICAGGIIHTVDQVLNLPAPILNSITSAQLEYYVSILTEGGYLSKARHQYVDEIFDSTDVTYFVPNSQAAASNFAELAKSFSDEDLKKNFLYHIVPKYLGYSSNLQNNTLTTAEGSNLTITIQGKDIYVNAAKVIAADYLVSNGVIHVIDGLLDRFNTSRPIIPSLTTNRTSSTSIPASILEITISMSSGSASSVSTHSVSASSVSASSVSKSSVLTSSISSVPTSSVSAAMDISLSAPELTTPSFSIPTATGTTLPTPLTSSQSNDLRLKVGIGAGIGGAAVISLLGIFLFMRRRKFGRMLPLSEGDCGDQDSNSMFAAPNDPKRYFVKNGSLHMRDTTSVKGMIPVTNLENDREGVVSYYFERPIVPLKSPSRLNGRGNFF